MNAWTYYVLCDCHHVHHIPLGLKKKEKKKKTKTASPPRSSKGWILWPKALQEIVMLWRAFKERIHVVAMHQVFRLFDMQKGAQLFINLPGIGVCTTDKLFYLKKILPVYQLLVCYGWTFIVFVSSLPVDLAIYDITYNTNQLFQSPN